MTEVMDLFFHPKYSCPGQSSWLWMLVVLNSFVILTGDRTNSQQGAEGTSPAIPADKATSLHANPTSDSRQASLHNSLASLVETLLPTCFIWLLSQFPDKLRNSSLHSPKMERHAGHTVSDNVHLEMQASTHRRHDTPQESATYLHLQTMYICIGL